MSAKTVYSERQLVSDLKINSRDSFEYLYDHYSGPLYGIILKIVKSEEVAADVLQDAFLKIWKNMASYDVEKGTLFTWLLNVARNTAIDRLRIEVKSSKCIDLNSVPERELSGAAFYPMPFTMDVKALVDKLSHDRKVLIDLVYFQGYTHEEAAKVLSVPLGTVKSRIRKALQDLRQTFAVQPVGLRAA